MNTKKKPGPESIVREIKRRTRRKYSAEEKIRIVLEGFGIRINRYMKDSQSEKMEVIRIVEESNPSIRNTLQQIDISRSTFYEWYKRYLEYGYEGLAPKHKTPLQFWNAIPEWEKQRRVEIAKQYPEKSCREVAFHIQIKKANLSQNQAFSASSNHTI